MLARPVDPFDLSVFDSRECVVTTKFASRLHQVDEGGLIVRGPLVVLEGPHESRVVSRGDCGDRARSPRRRRESVLRERAGNYSIAMGAVLVVALVGALSIMMLPRHTGVAEPALGRPCAQVHLP